MNLIHICPPIPHPFVGQNINGRMQELGGYSAPGTARFSLRRAEPQRLSCVLQDEEKNER